MPFSVCGACDPEPHAARPTRHLDALRSIKRTGSFRAAASELGYVQSAISHQIATLEETVGQRLVSRTPGGRRLELTPAGELLLAHSENIVAHARAAQGRPGRACGRKARHAPGRNVPEHRRAPRPTAPRTLELGEHLRSLGLTPRFVFESDINATVLGFVANGYGAAIVPRLMVHPPDDRVRIVELEHGLRMSRRIGLVRDRHRRNVPGVAEFEAVARQTFALLLVESAHVAPRLA